jgi:hypothetical protein
MKYDTEESVFHHAAEHLSIRFHLAYSAPCYSNQLLDNIGHFCDTQCAQDILDGMYAFPPDTNVWTIKILREAHYTYKLLSKEIINTMESVVDIQNYWQSTNEKISSSFSRIHFGHHKAASFDRNLSALHAAKLSTCAMKEIPLARWGVGLTVPLEKTCGNNNITKMRAICLLEGDFNYYNKVIFACRMMISAQEKGQIPLQCFTRKGSSCINAVMTKIMICSESWTHPYLACIRGNDFGDCYDRVAYPPASIALQSWEIRCEPVCVLLSSMQTMCFFLCTGFGESTESYGRSIKDCTLGLGQGIAASGPGFLALSAQIVNAYLCKGHGAHFQTSYTRRPFRMAAVIYVDKMDLTHMKKSITASPSKLIAHSR